MKVTQHRPAFFEGFENEVIEVNTKEELLNIKFIKNFSEQPNFYRYSITDNCLMAEFENGKKWWVVAHLEDFDSLDLPKWQPPEE